MDAVFACVRKERLLARSGNPYLTVELRDQAGSVTGRVFRDADLLAGRFERGDLVRVRGRAELFRDELQLAVEQIARVELSERGCSRASCPSPAATSTSSRASSSTSPARSTTPASKHCCERLLGDRELRAELRRAPCSLPSDRTRPAPPLHHAFLGGLLEHTVAVATMAVELCAVHPRLDRDLLLCAALVHDLGKTREYAYGAEITRTEEGRMLGHVELGLRLIAAHVPPTLSARAAHGARALRALPITAPRARCRPALRLAPRRSRLQRLNALDAGVKGAFEQGLGRIRARRRALTLCARETTRHPIKYGPGDADHESVGDRPSSTGASVSELSLLRPAEGAPAPAHSGRSSAMPSPRRSATVARDG